MRTDAFMQELSQAMAKRVQPMSQQTVAEAGKAFLKRAAEILAGVGYEVATSSCSTAQQITALEAELRGAIGAWKHTEDGIGRPPQLSTCILCSLLQKPQL